MHQPSHMKKAPRCRARIRNGKLCQSPVVKGKSRCRIHGGAPGSGAPIGNRNALKHGRYSAEAIAARREIRALLRKSRELAAQVKK
jgi:glucans biosynthesis protein